jgi:hypothetical protein
MYTSGSTFRVRLVVDVSARRYSAFIRPAGGAEMIVGTDLVFGPGYDAVTHLSDVMLVGGNGSMQVCNIKVGQPPASTCVASSGQWQNTAIPARHGVFTVEANVIPSGGTIDGAFALSAQPATAWNGLAAIILFDSNGDIVARNGNRYEAVNRIGYKPGANHRVRLVVNVESHTYTAFVKPGGKDEALIGSDFAFRSEQSAISSIANWAVFTEQESVRVCNFTVR